MKWSCMMFACILLSGCGTMKETHTCPSSVPTSDNLMTYAVYMSQDYMLHIPVKPKTNEELLSEYVRAYKNFKKALDETNGETNYVTKIVQ